jgi:hypothetical protein
MAAAAPVLPYLAVASTVLDVAQKGAAGSYNKAVNDRNAQIQMQEAQAAKDQGIFNLQQADQQYQQLKGRVNVNAAASGVDLSSETAQRINFANAQQKIIQDHVIQYNADIASAKKIEAANYSTIQGNIAMQQARSSQIGSIANLGSSLLTMSKFM